MKRQLRNHLQLRMLRAIIAIEEQQSLLRASGALGVTQPSLTRTLRDVEIILGGPLFERHPRGVHPTPFGSIACEGARRILAQIDQLDDDLGRFLAGDTAVVAIGAMAPAAIGVLPGFFAYLRRKAPDIRICVNQGTTEELLPHLVGGEIAFVLGRLFLTSIGDRFAHEVLYDEPIAILARARHPIFSDGPITTDALSQYDFVLPRMSQRVEQEFEALLAAMGMHSMVGLHSSSLPFLRELLHSSDNLTISPPQTMGGDIARGTIRVVPFDIPCPPRPAGLLFMRNRRRSMAEQRVVETLREYLRNSHSVSTPALADQE
jgi:LysR family pca operon transcriptional activator